MPNWVFTKIKTKSAVYSKYINEKGDVDFNLFCNRPTELDMTEGSITKSAITFYLTDRFTLTAEESNLHQYLKKNNRFFSPFSVQAEYNSLKEWYLSKPDYQGVSWDDLYQLGKQYVSNLEKYGHYTWYSWSIEHWGTKWNAADTCVDANNETVSFNTAWSEPIPFLEHLCSENPNEEIEIYAENEDGSVCIYSNDNGKLVVENQYVIDLYGDEDEEEDA